MKTIIDYMVIRNDILCELIKSVQNHIKHNWQPIGGISKDSLGFYMQEMVVFEKEKEEPSSSKVQIGNTIITYDPNDPDSIRYTEEIIYCQTGKQINLSFNNTKS